MEKSNKRKSWMQTLGRQLLAGVALLVGAGMMSAAPVKVTGTVTSAQDGEPLIGASVFVVGTTTGASTDIDGNYTINAEMGQTLRFSYVGMNSREIKVTGAKLDVALLENSSVLDEVVVVGYGTQKKKLVTGATSQVKGDEIAKMNTTSPLQAMQGQMPGVQISSESGQPGAGMKVSIRGLGTTGNASPLYLIDGVGGDISTLNPNDIESIDVLKDAASAAIYGAQAANGVVLVTTKSGKEGTAKVTFDGYCGWQDVAHSTKMLNAREYMTIMDEQQVNSGDKPYDWSSFKSIYDADGNLIDTDWLGSMFHNGAITQSYNLGVSGGSKTSTYAVSAGYVNQEGIVGGPKVSNYNRYNFRVNSDHHLFGDILTIGEQVAFVYRKSTSIGDGNVYNNTLRGAFNTSPLAPIYDADGNYNCTTNSDWYNNDGNPYGAMMVNTDRQSKNATFNGNAYVQLQPIQGLKIRTVFGAVYNSSDWRSFNPTYEFSPYSKNTLEKVDQNMSNSWTLTWTNTASYDWEIKDHSFNVMIGMEASQFRGEYVGASNASLKEGFNTWPFAWVSNGTAASTGDGLAASGYPFDKTRTVSYFGRIGWNWKERYMINFTLRNDGSSKFAKGHRHGWFPSVSVGWNISNEKFMESAASWLSFLKIRASWGRVGNQNIDNYRYISPIKVTNTHYLFDQYLGPNGVYNTGYPTILESNWGAYPSRLGNMDLTWETSEQTNIGFDARLFNSRFGINFDFYMKNTKDWLVVAPILATAGTDAPFINGGNVKNTGIELNLDWHDTVGNDFSYNIGFNCAWNKNRVGAIPNSDGIIHGDVGMLYNNSAEFYRAENGHPIGYFWGYKTAGLFQNQQDIDEWIAAGNGILQNNVAPGDVKFVDLNHDGKISDEDKTDLGNGIPDFTYGVNINLYWKNFDLGIVGNGVAGNQLVQSYRSVDNAHANYTTRILDRWTGEGTSNKIPRVTTDYTNWQFSDLYIQNGDFFRISNITLGYNFAPLINKKWLSNCRLYFQVQNVATFTKYDGMDPEIGFGSQAWVSGIDNGFYPRSRTYLFGVNLAF